MEIWSVELVKARSLTNNSNILYFSGNSLEDIFDYLESKMGQELFEEVKRYMREVSING